MLHLMVFSFSFAHAYAYRYQKKIGTYDKQPWEQSVEHRILSGFVNTPSSNVTARTEYIDVDLVRGWCAHNKITFSVVVVVAHASKLLMRVNAFNV